MAEVGDHLSDSSARRYIHRSQSCHGKAYHDYGVWKVVEERTGPIENKPMSPVSIVVFSMLYTGPGEVRRENFSFTLQSVRTKERGGIV